MTALSIQPPFPLITDIDGQPLEDGYIWIGVANLPPIGNPIAVYWDAALTQPAALPVRTRGGYPVNAGTPARLYVNSDYSIQVQNKNGSVLYSAPQATERYGALIISSADVSFLQAGTSAVTRTAQAKMREWVSVKDFGAVGDGVTDDTAAIQAAFDTFVTLVSESGNPSQKNPKIVFPQGTYKTTGPLSIGASGRYLFGAAVDMTNARIVADFADYAIKVYGARDCELDFEVTNSLGGGVYIDTMTRCTVKKIDAQTNTNGYYGLAMVGAIYQNTFDRIYVTFTNYGGVWFDISAPTFYFFSGFISNNVASLFSNGLTGATRNTGVGLYIKGGKSSHIAALNIAVVNKAFEFDACDTMRISDFYTEEASSGGTPSLQYYNIKDSQNIQFDNWRGDGAWSVRGKLVLDNCLFISLKNVHRLAGLYFKNTNQNISLDDAQIRVPEDNKPITFINQAGTSTETFIVGAIENSGQVVKNFNMRNVQFIGAQTDAIIRTNETSLGGGVVELLLNPDLTTITTDYTIFTMTRTLGSGTGPFGHTVSDLERTGTGITRLRVNLTAAAPRTVPCTLLLAFKVAKKVGTGQLLSHRTIQGTETRAIYIPYGDWLISAHPWTLTAGETYAEIVQNYPEAEFAVNDVIEFGGAILVQGNALPLWALR